MDTPIDELDALQIEEAVRVAAEVRYRETLLDALRGRMPSLERAVYVCQTRITELEAHLATLQTRRESFVKELATLDDPNSRTRRRDLFEAIDAIDGFGMAAGTLIDDLRDQPRIAGTELRLTKERQRLAEAERTLQNARAELNVGEVKGERR